MYSTTWDLLRHNAKLNDNRTNEINLRLPSRCHRRLQDVTYYNAVIVTENHLLFERPFVKRLALCYRTDNRLVCLSELSCLSVTLMYCGQTVGWIKMKLGMEVGLGQRCIVLDGDPAPQKGGAAAPNFRPMFILAKRSPIPAEHLLLLMGYSTTSHLGK